MPTSAEEKIDRLGDVLADLRVLTAGIGSRQDAMARDIARAADAGDKIDARAAAAADRIDARHREDFAAHADRIDTLERQVGDLAARPVPMSPRQMLLAAGGIAGAALAVVALAEKLIQIL